MAYVVLELAEPTEINGIDIGNEHSCFIEVRVGRKGDSDADFKELLLTSSFQTPNESRNSENPNRVRCFNKSALVESNASQKWQLIKLICTQTFNSRVQYGISFVTVYTPEENKKDEAPAAKDGDAAKKKGGLMSLRGESPDSDSDTNASSLFSRWKQARQNGSDGGASPARVTAAAAIRDARTSIGERKSPLVLTPTASTSSSSSAIKKRAPPSTDTPVRDRNRAGLLYDDDDEEEGNEKLKGFIEKDKQRAQEELRKDPKHKPEKAEATPAKKMRLFDDDTTAKNGQGSSKSKKPKSFKPFKKLLEGVVLTISGIQNPERATLREKALAMGAKYRSDWDDSCTHLICAYRNTPKYNQVKGVGKIVRKDWVLDCHQKRRNLPWRRYALETKEAGQSESEDEVWDERDKEPGMGVDADEEATVSGTSSTKKPEVDDDDDDILMMYDQVEAPVVICDSESDNDYEIEIMGTKTEGTKPNDALKVDGVEEENGAAKTGEFFRGKTFCLDDDNGAVKIIKFAAIISKHGG